MEATPAYYPSRLAATLFSLENSSMTQPAKQAAKKPPRRGPCPLYQHKTGQWAKTILGKKHYFGVDRDEAWDAYLAAKDYLHAGKTPPHKAKADSLTVADIIGSFRKAKESACEAGELSERTLNEYKLICQTTSKVLGKTTPAAEITSEDLARLKAKVAKGKGGQATSPISLKRRLTYVRSIFLHANEELDCHIKYRKPLASPSAKVVRKHKNLVGERLFTAEEIRSLLLVASDQLKAMIWLGITCGFGNRDCATLPIETVDLANGWHDYWRPKTQNPRRAPLTPETAAALYAVIQNRKQGLVFMTKYGRPWYHEVAANRCPIAAEFRKLCKRVGITGASGVKGFYSLRRTCQTVGEAAGEPTALKFLMGHTPPSDDMGAVYRQRTWDTPLLKISEHLRAWVLGEITLR